MLLHGPNVGAEHLERGALNPSFFLSPDSVPGQTGAVREVEHLWRGALREVRVYITKSKDALTQVSFTMVTIIFFTDM